MAARRQKNHLAVRTQHHPVLGAYRDGMAIVDEQDQSPLYQGEPCVWCGWCFVLMQPHSEALHARSVRLMTRGKGPVVLMLLAVLGFGCQLRTDGLTELGPTNWGATVACPGEPLQAMRAHEPVQVGSWGCLASSPSASIGQLDCWTASAAQTRDSVPTLPEVATPAVVTLEADCGLGSASSVAFLDGCEVEVTCGP